ncbi:hypothetical protein [Candidimonas nitroreducens]|nr:hypothetical protein [Candidimonas nitroreducens]
MEQGLRRQAPAHFWEKSGTKQTGGQGRHGDEEEGKPMREI